VHDFAGYWDAAGINWIKMESGSKTMPILETEVL
jgi:hypothetical protein